LFRGAIAFTIRRVDHPPSSTRQRVIFWAKLAVRVLILALVTWGISRTVISARDQFAAAKFSLAAVQPGWLVAAGVFYLLGMLPCCLFWQSTLWSMGQRPRFLRTLRAFYVGHLGKYVPGKALVVIIRTGLIRGPQVDTTVAATSVFVETLTMMAVGAVVAAVILAVQFREHQTLLWLAVGLAVCAGLPTLPPIFQRIVRTLRVHRASPNVEAAIRGLNFRLMAFGWCIVAVGWVLFGMSLWATLHAMPDVRPTLGDLPLLTACVSLAMVAGFLSLLPGGIGVREYVVMQLVSPAFGAVAAIVSAVLLRLVWLAAELVAAGVLSLGAQRGAMEHTASGAEAELPKS
jgi:uncharacterized membrane protein YbhN (UPF0104 family)